MLDSFGKEGFLCLIIECYILLRGLTVEECVEAKSSNYGGFLSSDSSFKENPHYWHAKETAGDYHRLVLYV